MKKLITAALLCTSALVSLNTSAAIVTFGNGNISSDTNSDIIVDHLNNRQYLRFDALAPMTYAEQVTLTTTGAYSDYTIADSQINFDFITALLDGDTGGCNATTNSNIWCNPVSVNGDSWTEGLLGQSYTHNWDLWFFDASQPGASQQVGMSGIYKDGRVHTWPNWGSQGGASHWGTHASYPIHLLMYKDTVNASSPSTLALFGLGLLGLSMRRSKAKS